MPGFQVLEVTADADGPALDGAMWYPCSEPPAEIDLGEITAKFGIIARGAMNCKIRGDRLPLVVVSHGKGSDFVLHHDTAETLADAGFVVAAVNHPGDTFFDISRISDLSVMVERPTDIMRLVDFTFGISLAASKIDPERIGFFGFSRGGYTGLVLIGGDPDWASEKDFCPQDSFHWCEQIRSMEFPTQPLAHDPRIKAAVIVDPLAVFFTTNSCAAVEVPVQLWASEHGGDGVLLESVAAVERSLPAKHEYHVVPKAGHFAFLMPCPPTLARDRPEVCTDAPGFDRGTFLHLWRAGARFEVGAGDPGSGVGDQTLPGRGRRQRERSSGRPHRRDQLLRVELRQRYIAARVHQRRSKNDAAGRRSCQRKRCNSGTSSSVSGKPRQK
jgi:predicted dienelactone hydrolase